MNYEIKFMEGFRKWASLPSGALVPLNRYFPSPFITAAGGGNAVHAIRDLTLSGVAYRCFVMTNAGNYGNGQVNIRNIVPSPKGANKRIYMGWRYCSNGATPQNVGWQVINISGSVNMSVLALPGLPATTGTWYFEAVLDRAMKRLWVYRNGVKIAETEVIGEISNISYIFVGNAADQQPWYGKSWGVTDVYVAHDDAAAVPTDDYQIHGPIIVEDADIAGFSAPGWQPSESTLTTVETFNIKTGAYTGLERVVNSPFDGTPGIANFAEVKDGDIRGVMVGIRSKRGTSSTGKIKVEVGNENFSKIAQTIISVPPYVEAAVTGYQYVAMANDFNNSQWISDTIKGIRMRVTSIAEMSKEK